jgi:beta-lactam-binding protein with PASTA domain
MGKRTSEFMRSVHIKTIRTDLQRGKAVEEAEQHLRAVGVSEEELLDLLTEAGYYIEQGPAAGQDYSGI